GVLWRTDVRGRAREPWRGPTPRDGPASREEDRRAVTGQRAVGRTGGRWRGSDALWTGTSPENTPGMHRVGRQGETSRCGVAPRRAAIASTGAVPADVPIYGFVC